MVIREDGAVVHHQNVDSKHFSWKKELDDNTLLKQHHNKACFLHMQAGSLQNVESSTYKHTNTVQDIDMTALQTDHPWRSVATDFPNWRSRWIWQQAWSGSSPDEIQLLWRGFEYHLDSWSEKITGKKRLGQVLRKSYRADGLHPFFSATIRSHRQERHYDGAAHSSRKDTGQHSAFDAYWIRRSSPTSRQCIAWGERIRDARDL